VIIFKLFNSFPNSFIFWSARKSDAEEDLSSSDNFDKFVELVEF